MRRGASLPGAAALLSVCNGSRSLQSPCSACSGGGGRAARPGAKGSLALAFASEPPGDTNAVASRHPSSTHKPALCGSSRVSRASSIRRRALRSGLGSSDSAPLCGLAASLVTSSCAPECAASSRPRDDVRVPPAAGTMGDDQMSASQLRQRYGASSLPRDL